jgi:hypothetical protein
VISLHSDKIRLVAFATFERAKSNNGEPDCAASVGSSGRRTRGGSGLASHTIIDTAMLPNEDGLLMTREQVVMSTRT